MYKPNSSYTNCNNENGNKQYCVYVGRKEAKEIVEENCEKLKNRGKLCSACCHYRCWCCCYPATESAPATSAIAAAGRESSEVWTKQI